MGGEGRDDALSVTGVTPVTPVTFVTGAVPGRARTVSLVTSRALGVAWLGALALGALLLLTCDATPTAAPMSKPEGRAGATTATGRRVFPDVEPLRAAHATTERAP